MPEKMGKQKCSFSGCKKRVKILMTIPCKCKGKFCKKHKNEETHNCTYDHQEAFRAQFIKSQNRQFRHISQIHGGGSNCAC